jgi:dimethylglycine catabolism B
MSLQDRRQYQESCVRCSQCKFVPAPASREFASLCPSIDHGEFHAYSGGGKVITSYALMEGKAAVTERLVDSVFSCTMCGACDTACKTNEGDNVEPLDTLYELRAHLAREGHVPAPMQALVERLRAEGSHHGSRAERSRWAAGLGLKDATREPVAVLLHVGGSNAFDRSQWGQLRALVRLLEAARVDFGIAFDAERDAGSLAYDLGFQEDARALALHQQQLLKASGAGVLLVAGAEDYAAFRNLYPRLGVALQGVRVVHSTEFLEELLITGQLKLQASREGRVTYHDPCRLGRLSELYTPWQGQWITVLNTVAVPDSPRPVLYGNGGQYDAPRRLLQRVQGLELVEMERNREFAYCCGAGAAAALTYPAMANRAALKRLEEARATGADCVVTACAGCQRHLAAAAAAHGIALHVQGVLEVLAQAAGA